MRFEANRSNYSNTSENNNKSLVKSSYIKKKANLMISENKDTEILKEILKKILC